MNTAIKRLLATVALLILAAGVFFYTKHKRAADNRAKCLENLKVLAMAASGYNQEYRRWPSGTIQNPKLPPAQRMSWQVGVGSFIESSNPLAVINRSEAFNSEYNEPIFDRALGKATFFKCPTFQQPPNSQFSYLTTYVGVAGLGADAASFPKGDRRDGFFGYDRTIRDADVTDGLANTMTIIETQRANGPVTEGGPSTVRGLDPAGGQTNSGDTIHNSSAELCMVSPDFTQTPMKSAAIAGKRASTMVVIARSFSSSVDSGES